MKTIRRIIFSKTLFIILTIAIMLFSNFVPIISWAVENSETTEETEDEYVKFDLTWSDGETEITRNAGIITANFSLKFDTLQSFKDFRIEVERINNVEVNYYNSGEYFGESSSVSQIQYFKDIPGGTIIDGTIRFNFSEARDFQRYQKDLVVKLIGTYELNDEEINVELTKNLTAIITTLPKTTYHDLSLDIDSYVGENVKTSSNTSELYVVSEITQSFCIDYKCINSEYQKFDFTIFRTASNNNNVYYPDEVTFSDSSFTLTKVKDGEYIAERGAEHEEYDKDNIEFYKKRAQIKVKYIIENAAEDISTIGKIYIVLTSKGYNVTRSENGSSGEKSTLIRSKSYSQSKGLHSNTTGNNTWANTYIYTSEHPSYYTKNDIEDFLQKDKMEVAYDTKINYVSGVDTSGNVRISQYSPKLEYLDSNTNKYKTKTLSKEQMYVKKIELNDMKAGDDVWIKFYKEDETDPFFIATSDNLTYSIPENEKIGNFRAIISNPLINRQSGWKTTYEICASSLTNEEITEEDILNTRILSLNQGTSGNSYIKANQDQANYYILEGNIGEVSIFSLNMNRSKLDVNNYELAQETEGSIDLLMNNNREFEERYKMFINVKNTNPTFYVELPSEFDFRIKDVCVINNASRLKIKNYKIKKYNGKKVLEIEVEGQSNNINEGVRIIYNRKLKYNCGSLTGQFNVYMKTEEGKYYNSSEDINDYNKNGDKTDRLGYCSGSYSIKYNSQVQLQNNVYSASNDIKVNEIVKLNSEKTAKYAVTLINDKNTMSNINVVSRLPFIGNKTIIGSNLLDLGTTINLENLKNIEVYEEYKGEERKIDSTNYELGYSNEETANFETTFDTSEAGIATAKNLQIKMSDSYKLYRGNKLIIKYEMDIPETANVGDIASQMSAVKYTDN